MSSRRTGELLSKLMGLTNFQQPLKVLELDKEPVRLHDIIKRRKTAHILKGLWNYKVGDEVVLSCLALGFSLSSKLVEVRHTTFSKSKISDRECRVAGFHSYEAMIRSLGAKPDEQATIVFWGGQIKGFFYDHPEWLYHMNEKYLEH